MRSLLQFIHTYHFVILFILLECLSFVLLFQYNDYQRASFLNSSDRLSGSIYEKFSSLNQYLDLKEKNQLLLNNIADQRSHSKSSFRMNKVDWVNTDDSVYMQQFQYIPALVVNNSTNKVNNFLTLNVGRKQGIEKGMAVVSPTGIVGVVKDVSANYASVISLLNQSLKISAMFKESGYFGSINWDGKNYRYVTFSELPSHIEINVGDTVVTSGFSAMFPKGEMVGLVNEIDRSETGEFVEVQVELSVNFKKLQYVMVIRNLLFDEQVKLETESRHD